jgi:hypothetical protein
MSNLFTPPRGAPRPRVVPETPPRVVPATPPRVLPEPRDVPMAVDSFAFVEDVMEDETAAVDSKLTQGMRTRHNVIQGEKMPTADAREAAREATMLGGLMVVSRVKRMAIVDTNIKRVSRRNNFQVPDISWTEDMEKKYEEELEYSYNNDDYPYPAMLPNSSFGARPMIETDIVIELNAGHQNDKISEYWYHKATPPVEGDQSSYSKSQDNTLCLYSIDVNHLPAFRCIRGVGGAIYILRYFQFIDMVHDMCHKRGDKSNSWALNKKSVKSAYEKIKNLYIDDINWLINENIKPYLNSTPLSDDEIRRELAIFYAFICLKPIPNVNKFEFYDLSITIDTDGNPNFIKDKGTIPPDSANTLRVQYLLYIFMNIGEIKNADMLSNSINESSPCSSFLETNIDSILTNKGQASFIQKLENFIISKPKKIILHVDAESNKTGLCGIIPKFCDYATSTGETSVEYTKNFSSKEYDAAFIQQSEVYADMLNNSINKFDIDLDASKSAELTTIELKFGTKPLMTFEYERYPIYQYEEEIYLILNKSFKTTDITRLISERKITKYGLLYFLYLHYDNFNYTKNDPINNLISDIISIQPWGDAQKDNIKVGITNQTKAKNFYDHYGLGDLKTKDGIKLKITKAYSLNATNFGKGFKTRYNPFRATINATLAPNENLSQTSSVRAITYGKHYNNDYDLVDDFLIKNAVKNNKFHHRAWFKQIGDFGQALEFYGYTHNKFDKDSWPIFVSFDKLSTYLSSMFNELTCLETLKKNSINKLQFYYKSNRNTVIVNTNYRDPQTFGKVNYRMYNKQMHNKRMYNKRRYNISKRLKLMTESELKNKLKSVRIKITKTVRGKRKYLTRKELENKALLFNKLQNTAKRMKIKIMYKSKSRMYKYKTYKRLQKEINSKKINLKKKKINRKNKKNKSKNRVVRNFNFG